MPNAIPSSKLLRAFEASARHASFTRAAQELCVTQGAVSRAVAELEDELGLDLFVRVGKRLVVTDAGTAYLARIGPALREIEAATSDLFLHRARGGVLRIAVLPTFNAKWLIPRIASFAVQHPEVMLEFEPHTTSYAFDRSSLDCAIRYGAGVWPGAMADYVDGRKLVVVGAPRLVGKRPLQGKDIGRFTLLHHTSVPNAWQEWFAGTQAEARGSLAGPRFDQYSVLIQAASAALGLALVPECLVQDELSEGLVVTPFDHVLEASTGYFLCYPETRADHKPLRVFRDWILQEASKPRTN